MQMHRDRRMTQSRRQKTGRRFAVALRAPVAASGGSSGRTGPAFATLLATSPLRAITTTSSSEYGP